MALREASVPVRLLFRVPDGMTDERVAQMVENCLEHSTIRDAFDAACESAFADPSEIGEADDWPGYDGYAMGERGDA